MIAKKNLDIFAGGGGASLAMKRAGYPPHIALNHDPEAIAVHMANNPDCEHICQDVFEAKPRAVTRGAPIGGAWFSPDCTHHSKAKGGKPLDNKRRCLADVVIDYASDVGPDVIWLENVEEFAQWGPLNELMRPIKERKGEDFTRWDSAIGALGYNRGWAALSYGCRGDRLGRQEASVRAFRDWIAPGHGRRTLLHEEQPKMVAGNKEMALGARTLRGRCTTVLNRRITQRETRITRWPSERVHVFNLVAACLKRMSYGYTRAHIGGETTDLFEADIKDETATS